MNAEELGGAAVHCGISGVGDHFANNEIEAFQICRNIIANVCIDTVLPCNNYNYLD